MVNFKNITAGLLINLALFLSANGQNTNPQLFQKVDSIVQSIEADVIAWRRDFHEFPELSNQEFRTSAIVASHLRSLGMKVETGIAGTGVVGILEGGKPGGVIALRADMDALPITEELDLPFASQQTAFLSGMEVGVMHACGHDVHTSSLMGVATVLSAIREQLTGTVKFIFQPAEEGVFDADIWGAKMMVAEGVLEDPRPDAILGMHVWPTTTGKVYYTKGPMMASVDNFSLKLKGSGSHAAMPWDAADPIVAAAQIIIGAQTIVSRNINLPQGAAVISFGSIKAGNRNNIIPDEVVLLGTIRTHNEASRQLIHKRLEEMVNHTSAAFNVAAELKIDRLYPAVINNSELVERLLPAIRLAAGHDHVIQTEAVMIAEDFSYYANEIPGMFYFLGIVPQSHVGHVEPLHSPRFYVDEAAIKIAVRVMSYAALEALSHFSE